MTASVVVFDIGGVLVDWKPHLAWSDVLGDLDAVADFMNRVGFRDRNARADRGERFADLAAELPDPADQKLFAGYVTLFPRTVHDLIPGTWDILEALRARHVPLHAITNWSAETWPRGIAAHPRLGDVFGVTVVSGQEGVMKPDVRIYRILCERAGVAPRDCVFIDDGLHNVEGARAAGMDSIHFTGADALAEALKVRGLL